MSLTLVPSAVIIGARPATSHRRPITARGIDTLSVPMPFWPQVLDVAYVALPLSIVVPFAVVVARHRSAPRTRGASRCDGCCGPASSIC